jgi:hypothetical protein
MPSEMLATSTLPPSAMRYGRTSSRALSTDSTVRSGDSACASPAQTSRSQADNHMLLLQHHIGTYLLSKARQRHISGHGLIGSSMVNAQKGVRRHSTASLSRPWTKACKASQATLASRQKLEQGAHQWRGGRRHGQKEWQRDVDWGAPLRLPWLLPSWFHSH